MKKTILVMNLIIVGLIATACTEKKIYTEKELRDNKELRDKVYKQEKCATLSPNEIMNNLNCWNAYNAGSR